MPHIPYILTYTVFPSLFAQYRLWKSDLGTGTGELESVGASRHFLQNVDQITGTIFIDRIEGVRIFRGIEMES